MNFEAQGELLKQARERQTEYLNELSQKERQIQTLKVSLDTIQNTQGAVNDLKLEVIELRKQKADLEKQFEQMVSAPFFNKQAGESAALRAEKLEIEIETL